MLILLATIASALNLILILIKFKLKRKFDALLDFSLLALVFCVLNGSQLMLLVGIFSSLIVSIYLWFSKPNFKDFL